jgi:hypothetical protein
MAAPLQSGWRPASVLFSQRTLTNYESPNLGGPIEPPGDEVTQTGEYTHNSPSKISGGALWDTDEGSKDADTPQPSLAEPQTTGPPIPCATEPPVGLSDEEIVRLTDQLLLNETIDTQGPALLHELVHTIPAVADIVEGLMMKAWKTAYNSSIYYEPS